MEGADYPQEVRPDLKIYALDAAPTGLILITNLNPHNSKLHRSYDKIIADFRDLNLIDFGLKRFYSEIDVASTSIFSDGVKLRDVFHLKKNSEPRLAVISIDEKTNVTTLTIESLTAVTDWPKFAGLVDRGVRGDARFLHAAATNVYTVPNGLVRGVNIFGPGDIPSIENAGRGRSVTRRIESFLLNDATLSPQSMTIMDREGRLVFAAMESIGDPKVLASYDPNFFLDVNGSLCLSQQFFELWDDIDIVALPACGPGFPNYGHFLYDGLPGVMLHRATLGKDLKIVGQPLQGWQTQILDALDLSSFYVAVDRPTRFRKVLGTTMLSMHLPYPTRFIGAIFDQIRFRFGAQDGPSRNVFLSRGSDTSKRYLRNRAEVEATAAELGFDVVCTECLPFRDQVRLMASARVVIGEAGAAFANIGFCDPGAAVLEILPMPDPWTRAACFQLGHRWHAFIPRIDDQKLETASSGAALHFQDFSYRVDCAAFADAARAVMKA